MRVVVFVDGFSVNCCSCRCVVLICDGDGCCFGWGVVIVVIYGVGKVVGCGFICG